MSVQHKWTDPRKSDLPLSSNEFETPKWLFNALNKEFNFVFDLACTSYNKRVDNAFCIDEGTDSLEQDWHKIKGWLWLNPPYSPLKPWVTKTQREHRLGAKIVMLIPPIITTRYFSEVMPSEIRFLIGRVPFIGADGKEMKGNSHDSAIVIYGPSVQPKLSYVERDSLRGEP